MPIILAVPGSEGAMFPTMYFLPLKHYLWKHTPWTQFVVAIMALQTESQFSKRYAAGMSKKEYWMPYLMIRWTLLHAFQE